ncbi:cyclin-dependent kinase inhibitor 7-like isoform X2 [Tripterygium wilfordii]|uniref:cyclin-dependent kinase inhibitor 7-like isoform X2 n=1 Tax=Tripterygium wilfordii TaxID=458696 RepID=UPI0018F84061|nr:cyclin-dependent kinase inhibitor 7-like isoform X2 [Tripterygium wilfordii]
MGDSVRNCKRIAETAESTTTYVTKKPKICFDFEELQVPLSNFELRKDGAVVDSSERPSNSCGAVDGDPCSSSSSCFSQTSRCSSSKIVEECSRFVDRETKSFETEDSTCITSRLREATPSSDFFDSPVAEKSQHEKPVGTEMPSQGEIEAFFGISEKLEQKRFFEKYNFDVVNGVPLEGRFQWVPLK